MKPTIALTCLALACVLGCDDKPKSRKKTFTLTVEKQCTPGQPCPVCPAPVPSSKLFEVRTPFGQPFAPGELVNFDQIPIPIINDMPVSLRQHNYKGGSCYHASIQNVIILQGDYVKAMRYRDLFSSGAYTSTIARNLESMGFKFAYTNSGDMNFLYKALNSRRIIALPYKPGHAINLFGLGYFPGREGQWAKMLDNNHPQEWEWVPLATFEHNWKKLYGGSAITVIGTPLPPIPHVEIRLPSTTNAIPLELSSL